MNLALLHVPKYKIGCGGVGEEAVKLTSVPTHALLAITIYIERNKFYHRLIYSNSNNTAPVLMDGPLDRIKQKLKYFWNLY